MFRKIDRKINSILDLNQDVFEQITMKQFLKVMAIILLVMYLTLDRTQATGTVTWY